jgi:hypothetical protein
MRKEDHAHAAEHDEFALGEVDDPAGVVDEREAERDERVDRAGGQPREYKLQKLSHATAERQTRSAPLPLVGRGKGWG